MTRRIGVFLLLAAGAWGADPAEGVRAASAGWRAAAIRQDAAALERYLADDLVYAHASGHSQNKAEYIAAVTAGPSHYESFRDSETKIAVYGKTAVLQGFVDVKPAGRESYRVRTLEVYVENRGQWQMAAHQSTRLRR